MKKKKEQFILLFGIYLFNFPGNNLVDGALSKAIGIEIYLLFMEKENHTLISLKTFSAYLLQSKTRQYRLCYPRKCHTPGKF